MNELRAEQIRKQLMLDHDAVPDKLTDTLDELRVLQEVLGSPEELLSKYRDVSSELIDFLDRLHALAVSEAESGGALVDFSDSTVSQILLACIRGYPDYKRAFEGTNNLLNEEIAKSAKLGRQIFEIAQHYEEIIQEIGHE